MQQTPLIDLQSISYTYPGQSNECATSTLAVNGVSLLVRQGEYIALLGHNGSGKSTLARQCNALLIPTNGRALIAGLDSAEQGNWRSIRETVGMIFQNPDNQIIATVVEDDVA